MTRIVPSFLGPLIGMCRLASPRSLSTLRLPRSHHLPSIGSPSRARTSSLLRARDIDSAYTSELRIAVKTTNAITATNAARSTSGSRQPTGTTHFQLRDHHPRGGSAVGGGGGGRV